MSLIIPPGYAQVVWSFTCDGDSEPMVTTCGIDLSEDPGDADELTANRMFGAMVPGMIPVISSAYTLTHVTLYIGQDGGPTVVHESTSEPVEGEAGTPCPPNTAVLIRKRTDLAGRRGRGRFYIPGVAESIVEANGNLTAPGKAAWDEAVVDFYSRVNNVDIGAVAYPPVVLHRSEGIGVEPIPTPISLFAVEAKVATQRRRLRP